MSDHHRCTWVGREPFYIEYHDDEWGRPQHDSRTLWEMLMLEGFQAGLSWITILRKREGFRAGFAGFDPDKVAAFGEEDVARLMADPGVVRAQAKIRATIRGAQIYCEMRDRGEDFAAFFWAFTDGKVILGDGVTRQASTPLSEAISKELKRRGFKFVGPTIAYAWMQAAGMVDDHDRACFRYGKGAAG